MALALLGLGSNLGDRQRWLQSALDQLRAVEGLQVLATSRWRETPPAGGPDGQSAYLNGCALLQTVQPPETLLRLLQGIETALGRTRELVWGPRTIDLDLLLYDDVQCTSPALTLPHPRMAWRRFVIDPAAEIAPELCHPVLGWTMAQLRDHLTHTPLYVAIAGPIAAGKTTLASAAAARHHGRFVAEQYSPEQLQAFYADPAGQARKTELEFLERRARDLARRQTLWSPGSRPCVSDFWFDQSLAFARVWLPPQVLPAYEVRWRQLRGQVVRPRLTVLIDLPTEVLLARIRARGRPGEESLDAARLDALRHALVRQSLEPDSGPIMRLAGSPQATWENEISAAIVAMQ